MVIEHVYRHIKRTLMGGVELCIVGTNNASRAVDIRDDVNIVFALLVVLTYVSCINNVCLDEYARIWKRDGNT